MDANLPDGPVILVLETEFNKYPGLAEELDAALEAKARFFRGSLPQARVALGFGNWNPTGWASFDRAANASHELSLQALRASTRNDLGSYLGVADALVDGARELQRLYAKPILVSDLALSTHGVGFVEAQRAALERVFSRAEDLRAAGVYAIVYRSVIDTPNAPVTRYFGEAERHFGLIWAQNETLKPGFEAWREGVWGDGRSR